MVRPLSISPSLPCFSKRTHPVSRISGSCAIRVETASVDWSLSACLTMNGGCSISETAFHALMISSRRRSSSKPDASMTRSLSVIESILSRYERLREASAWFRSFDKSCDFSRMRIRLSSIVYQCESAASKLLFRVAWSSAGLAAKMIGKVACRVRACPLIFDWNPICRKSFNVSRNNFLFRALRCLKNSPSASEPVAGIALCSALMFSAKSEE